MNDERLDSEIEAEVQALDAQIQGLRAKKKALVEILAARGAEAHEARKASGKPAIDLKV